MRYIIINATLLSILRLSSYAEAIAHIVLKSSPNSGNVFYVFIFFH